MIRFQLYNPGRFGNTRGSALTKHDSVSLPIMQSDKGTTSTVSSKELMASAVIVPSLLAVSKTSTRSCQENEFAVNISGLRTILQAPVTGRARSAAFFPNLCSRLHELRQKVTNLLERGQRTGPRGQACFRMDSNLD